MALLAVVFLVTLALLYKTSTLGRHVDENHAEISAAIDERARVVSRTELSVALGHCNQILEGFSEVDRDPCRLVCYDYETSGVMSVQELSESVCAGLP